MGPGGVGSPFSTTPGTEWSNSERWTKGQKKKKKKEVSELAMTLVLKRERHVPRSKIYNVPGSEYTFWT